jgi:transporter family protein
MGVACAWDFHILGIWTYLPKLTTRYISPLSATIYELVGSILVGIVVLVLMRFRPDTHPSGFALAVATGVVGFIGALCYLAAVARGKVSLVVSFTALYPAMTILLGVFL